MINAWHFVGKTLRNGDKVPQNGKWLTWDGPLIMCESGLHASREPFDALHYAPGPILCKVRCDGEMIEQDDKLVCRSRLIVARVDATKLLYYFARMQALSVIHSWNAPDVVLDYLMTGDDTLRDAARAAARDAARDAARAAAGAAWDAAGAARAAARDAAWAAAGSRWGTYARKDFNSLVYETFS